MTFAELLDWQWTDYSAKHRNRIDLLIHIVAVPVFIVAALGLCITVLTLSFLDAIVAVLFLGIALFAQGQGHALEDHPPEPFTSRTDAVRRLLAEQFVTFPRFVWSGGWLANLRSGAW